MKAIGRFFRTLLILVVIVIGAAIAYAYSGHYDVAVGTGHNAVTNWYLELVRDRSIARRSLEIDVPDLTGADMVAAGAVGYDNSCAGCHGRPGREPSRGFDPRPPALTRFQPDPAAAFWVTRNGIKMSAMPARSADQLDDDGVWEIVAFLQTASSLTEGEYRELVDPPEPEPELIDEVDEADQGQVKAGDGEEEPSAEETGETDSDDESSDDPPSEPIENDDGD